jgi:hypothetical protein
MPASYVGTKPAPNEQHASLNHPQQHAGTSANASFHHPGHSSGLFDRQPSRGAGAADGSGAAASPNGSQPSPYLNSSHSRSGRGLLGGSMKGGLPPTTSWPGPADRSNPDASYHSHHTHNHSSGSMTTRSHHAVGRSSSPHGRSSSAARRAKGSKRISSPLDHLYDNINDPVASFPQFVPVSVFVSFFAAMV